MVRLLDRAAAVEAALLGVGFGIPAIVGIVSLASGRGIWRLFGLPVYGEGPFEDVGLRTTVPLLAGFLAVCVAECVTAVLLWRRPAPGRVLAIAILPFELVFWFGFSLPFGPPAAVIRTALVIGAWVVSRRRAPVR
jgi:hypothetical protein